jgi:glucose/arabinose dehydrogenase
MHYGGRMIITNDGTLYLTTGDGSNYREESQNPLSQLGALIRLNRDGSLPGDNPFLDGKKGDPYVQSFGHRNPQGLAYDSENDLIYLLDHGPKGGDEVNLIKSGANYGWPAATYGVNYSGASVSPFSSLPGMEDPIKYWVPSIAPSGMAFYNADLFPDWKGNLFVGALKDRDVRRLELDNGKVVNEEILFEEIGERIRDVRVGPKGHLYLLTDSKNGKLIRISPN